MAKRPLRVTGFTRFVIVMLIVAPIAYIAASYYNGEDGVGNIKNLLGIGEKTESPIKAQDANTKDISSELKMLREKNQKLQEDLDLKSKRIDELFKENTELKRELQGLKKSN